MRNRPRLFAALLALALTAASAAIGSPPPVTISPGEAHRFARLRDGCPTFSWEAVPDARAIELLVYAVEEQRLAPAPALRVRLSPRAASWSPSAEQCLGAAGRYAWFVRVHGEPGQVPERERTSAARLFELPSAPSPAELRAALDTLRRHLAGGSTLAAGELAELGATSAHAAGTGGAPAGSTELAAPEPAAISAPGITAIAGEVPDVSGITHGVYGTSHSPDGAGVGAENSDPAGADLLLAGAVPAKVTEAGLARSSGSATTFDFSNPGAGAMTLQVDGNPAWHAGNDGAGSTLDADLLDGLDAAGFAAATHAHAGGDITTGTVAEPRIASEIARDSEILPTVVAGGGGGSGIDADFLDGVDLAGFLLTGTDLWVNTTGDSMTGTLALDPTGSVANAIEVANPHNIDLGVNSNLTKVGARFLHNLGGLRNTSVGLQALSGTLTASPGENTAVGYQALRDLSSGYENTAVGAYAMQSTSTERYNTAVGFEALRSNQAGWNTALGWKAMRSNTSGFFNTATGAYALRSNSTGYYNSAHGIGALVFNASGDENTAIGAYALRMATAADHNTGLGAFALRNTTGSRNIGVGHRAGFSASTGSDNIFVGNEGVAGESATIRIGTAGTHAKSFVAGIRGTTTDVADAVTVLVDSAGQLGTVSSSRTAKEAIADMGEASARLLRLRPVTFRYKRPFADGGQPLQFGLIAEEVAEVFPELVASGADGRPETVKYHLLAALLLNEHQKLVAEVERLRAEVAARRDPQPPEERAAEKSPPQPAAAGATSERAVLPATARPGVRWRRRRRRRR